MLKKLKYGFIGLLLGVILFVPPNNVLSSDMREISPWYQSGTDVYLAIPGSIVHGTPIGEGHITIFPFSYSGITQGTWGLFADGTQFCYGGMFNSSVTQNDQIDYKAYLDVGTYTFFILARTQSICAILSLLIDGSTVGTIDLYSLILANNQPFSITGINITTPGLKTISFKAATQNGASTGWALTWTYAAFFRTL